MRFSSVAPRRSLPALAGSALVALVALGSCGERSAAPGAEEAAPPIFVDRAEELGLDFVHFNGMTGDFLYPEMMGAGGALLDYDDDGDLDLFLVQGARLGSGTPVFPPEHPEPLSDRLYRNDLEPARSGGVGGRLVDRTARMGALSTGYGMGVAAGDYDADGLADLYVTNLGPNTLLRNLGDGTFADETAASGTGDDRWSVPATFVDFDRDGRLDLFVGNYVEYRVDADKTCFGPTGARDYCGPTAYPGARDRLFRNLGDGSFTEVASAAGIDRPGRTLGAIAHDFDADGWPELYVANDGEANFLWLNRGGRFEEAALPSGTALDGAGRPQASMGVAVADFDNDGDDDLLLTHLSGESNTLYRNEGGGRFADASRGVGLTAASLRPTGFGAAWVDVDLDGWLDLITVNGAVKALEEQRRVGDPHPLKQRKQLLRNLDGGRFEEASEPLDGPFGREAVGRGLALGDVDGDGDGDLLVVNNGGAAELLINRATDLGGWVGVAGPPPGFRASVQAAGLVRSALSRRDGSYASARDARVVLGLGAHRGPVDLRLERGERRLVIRSVPTRRYLVFGR